MTCLVHPVILGVMYQNTTYMVKQNEHHPSSFPSRLKTNPPDRFVGSVWPRSGKVNLQIERRWSWCTAPCLSAAAIWAAWGSGYLTKVTRRPDTQLKLDGHIVIVWIKTLTLDVVSLGICWQMFARNIMSWKTGEGESGIQGHFDRDGHSTCMLLKLFPSNHNNIGFKEKKEKAVVFPWFFFPANSIKGLSACCQRQMKLSLSFAP